MTAKNNPTPNGPDRKLVITRESKRNWWLTHEKFGSIESRDHHQEGWQSWIDRLAKFVEAK